MNKRRLFYIFFALVLILGLSSCGKKIDDNPPDIVPPKYEEEMFEHQTLYISPNAQWLAKGTKEDPFIIYEAFGNARPNTTYVLLPGTYSLDGRVLITKSGSPKQPITLKPEKPDDVVVLDFSKMDFGGNNRGIQLEGNHWIMKDFDIKGAGDNGLYIAGSYNVIENCRFYENQDSGLQLGRANSLMTDINDWPSHNLIKNCTSFDNYDPPTKGENADGFAAKLTVGQNNIFDGCIAYRNSDDGWDLYAKPESGLIGTVLLYNCIAFENGVISSGLRPTEGDGNGFKLGGSVLKGDAYMENCLSFNNAMHGVTDNSNPGVLNVNKTTSVNNGVRYTDTYMTNVANSNLECSNYDLARSSASYNNLNNSVSLYTIDAPFADRHKGAISKTVLANTRTTYKSYDEVQDFFCDEDTDAGFLYPTFGAGAFANIPGELARVDENGNLPDFHTLWRNADGSINIGDLFEVTDPYLKELKAGAVLNKTSQDQYTTYQRPDYAACEDPAEIEVLATTEAILLPLNPKNVFQDFQVFTTMRGANISWSSSNESIISFETEEEISVSYSKQIWAVVHRSREKNQNVTITATVTKMQGDVEHKLTKDFNLTVVKDTPYIGNISNYENRYIVDQGVDFQLPTLRVDNGSRIRPIALVNNVDYQIEYSYLYAINTTSERTPVSMIDKNVAGVYFVTATITSLMDASDTKTINYNVFIASPDAQIDFIGGVIDVNVTRDGFLLQGNLSNVVGYVYVLVNNNVTATGAEIVAGGNRVEFRDDFYRHIYENTNNQEYNIHVVITNKNGAITSNVYSKQVRIQNISTPQQFYNVATGESDPTTIYRLVNNIDFASYTWQIVSHTNQFRGLLDGNGFTVKNLSINALQAHNAAEYEYNINIFYKFTNATMMNITFEEIDIIAYSVEGVSPISRKVGIIGGMSNSFVDNVKIKNINVYGKEAVSALIGHISSGINEITRVSLINDENHTIIVDYRYCGGLAGNIQVDSGITAVTVIVRDCIVRTNLGNNGMHNTQGGILGRIKNELAGYIIDVARCFYEGKISTQADHAGGIIGGCESGAGQISVAHCASNAVILYKTTLYEQTPDMFETIVGHKNGSPIFGRLTQGTGTYYFENNFGSFDESNNIVGSISTGFFDDIVTKNFYENSLKWDLTNTWIFNETTKKIELR